MTQDEIRQALEDVQRHATDAQASADAAKGSAEMALDQIADVMVALALPEPPVPAVEPPVLNIVAARGEQEEDEPGSMVFIVERVGDDTAAVSVNWAISGDVDDADFIDGDEPDRLLWAEGDGAPKRIELTIQADTDREPDEKVIVTLSEPTNATLGTAVAEQLLVNDDIPASGEVCATPYMGPIRRLSPNKRVIMHHAGRVTGPYAGLAPIAAQLTKVAFIPGGSYPQGTTYDHSDAGIRAFGDRVYEMGKKCGLGGSQCRILWHDWEEFNTSKHNSINVPKSVGYDAARDTFHAAFYELTIYPGYSTFKVTQEHADTLRKEAARFSAGICKRVLERARADNLVGFEQFSYCHPDVPGKGSTWASQAADIHKTWFCPYMLGGGTPCYFQGTLEVMQANVKNPSYWTSTFAKRVQEQRKAFGPTFKIIPTIWCKWYNNGMSNSQNASFPNGDPCVPAGFMTKCMNDILDAGADGACFFQNADMSNSSGALAGRYSARHGEVADVVKRRGNFVGIRY